MDWTILIVIAAFVAAYWLSLSGEKAGEISGRITNGAFYVQEGIRNFYENLRAKSNAPSTPFLLRVVYGTFVRFSWYLWVAVGVVFILMSIFGKAIRIFIRGTLYS